MGNKFDRLLYILNLLDQRRKVRVSRLVEELGVTERTIYRYLNSLQNAGFPIFFDQEKGSYSFPKNFSLRRTLLETEEALVLALAKEFLAPNLGTRAAKVLDQIEKKTIFQNKLSSSLTGILTVQGHPESPHLLNLLRDLYFAIKEYQIVEIEYEIEPGKGKEFRPIEPYFIFFTGDFWYVQAWCRKKNGLRTFALDKIRSWRLTDQYFLPNRDVPSVEEVQETFGPYVDAEIEEVVLHFAPEVRQYFLRKKWLKDQECRDLENGWLEVRFKVRGLEGFKHWLYRWLPYFKIISPDWFREEVRQDLRQAIKTQ